MLNIAITIIYDLPIVNYSPPARILLYITIDEPWRRNLTESVFSGNLFLTLRIFADFDEVNKSRAAPNNH